MIHVSRVLMIVLDWRNRVMMVHTRYSYELQSMVLIARIYSMNESNHLSAYFLVLRHRFTWRRIFHNGLSETLGCGIYSSQHCTELELNVTSSRTNDPRKKIFYWLRFWGINKDTKDKTYRIRSENIIGKHLGLLLSRDLWIMKASALWGQFWEIDMNLTDTRRYTSVIWMSKF